jgi:hypothetical protein
MQIKTIMTLYEQFLESVAKGSRFQVDLLSRTVKVDKRALVDHGRFDGELGVLPVSTEEAFVNIEGLYARYKHSIPSERSESRRRIYFKALKEHEIEDDDMLYGESRETAQATLEFMVLAYALNGSLKWNDSMGSYFWQSDKDKDLVKLRKWRDNNN